MVSVATTEFCYCKAKVSIDSERGCVALLFYYKIKLCNFIYKNWEWAEFGPWNIVCQPFPALQELSLILIVYTIS